MKNLYLLAYLACVFTFVTVFAHACRKDWYPRHFAVTVGGVFTLVAGAVSGFGMWSLENTVNRGVPHGPADLTP